MNLLWDLPPAPEIGRFLNASEELRGRILASFALPPRLLGVQPMTAGDKLLEAILADPHADDLRLIYADWLDDHGQGHRADLIRVQVERARLTGHDAGCPSADEAGVSPMSCRYCSLVCRDAYLRELDLPRGWHGLPADWFVCNRPAPDGWEPEEKYVAWCGLERGFVASVTLPLDAATASLPWLLRLHPVTRVGLTDRRPLETPETAAWWREVCIASRTRTLPDDVWDRLSSGVAVATETVKIWTGEDRLGRAVLAASEAMLDVARARKPGGQPR